MNAPLTVTASGIYCAIKMIADPRDLVPPNSGCWRPVRAARREPGTVVQRAWRPRRWSTPTTRSRIACATCSSARSRQLAPDRVMACSQGTSAILTLGGVDYRTGGRYVSYETIKGGFGARPIKDGINGHRRAASRNTMNTPIEILEMSFPVRVERYALRARQRRRRAATAAAAASSASGACWAGRRRPASVSSARSRRPSGWSAAARAARAASTVTAPDGAERELTSKGAFTAPAGAVIALRAPGSGGYGPAGGARSRAAPRRRRQRLRVGRVRGARLRHGERAALACPHCPPTSSDAQVTSMNATDLCYTPATELMPPDPRQEALAGRADAGRARADRARRIRSSTPSARSPAERALRRRARARRTAVMKGGALGPLHGVPFSIKDLALTQGRRTMSRLAASSQHRVPDTDAPFVRRLKEAGGVMLGKTTTPEFGWKALGDSPLTGITRNPWNTGMTTGGSSAGAGAAAAAGLGPLHQGSDGAGSIRIPSAFCGIFGHKPSYGRVPMWPMSNTDSASHTGPMTRTVADAALMLSVMAGPDLCDRTALDAPPADYVGPPRRGRARGCASRGAPTSAGCAWTPRWPRWSRQAALAFEGLGAAVEEVKPGFADTREMIRCMWNVHEAGQLRRVPGRVPGPDGPGARRLRSRTACATAAPSTSPCARRKLAYWDTRAPALREVRSPAVAHRVRRRLRRGPAQSRGLAAASRGTGSTGPRSATRSTSPASPRPPCPPASRPGACRSGCRSSAAAGPTSRCCRPRAPSSRPAPGRPSDRRWTERQPSECSGSVRLNRRAQPRPLSESENPRLAAPGGSQAGPSRGTWLLRIAEASSQSIVARSSAAAGRDSACPAGRAPLAPLTLAGTFLTQCRPRREARKIAASAMSPPAPLQKNAVDTPQRSETAPTMKAPMGKTPPVSST